MYAYIYIFIYIHTYLLYIYIYTYICCIYGGFLELPPQIIQDESILALKTMVLGIHHFRSPPIFLETNPPVRPHGGLVRTAGA